jgi:hypothetical protein
MTESVQFQQVSEIPGLVLSTARFADFGFDRHFHLDFHVGLVTDGIQRQRVNGKTVLHGPGTIVLMPPGEIHDGITADGSQSTLKTFRLSQELLASVAEEISGLHREPEFAGALLEDPLLAGHLLRLHNEMRWCNAANSLAMQTEWLSLLESLLSQSRAVVAETVHGSLSRIQWERVRDYCFSHLSDRISLDELAGLCSLGKFQFLKQFKHDTSRMVAPSSSRAGLCAFVAKLAGDRNRRPGSRVLRPKPLQPCFPAGIRRRAVVLQSVSRAVGGRTRGSALSHPAA